MAFSYELWQGSTYPSLEQYMQLSQTPSHPPGWVNKNCDSGRCEHVQVQGGQLESTLGGQLESTLSEEGYMLTGLDSPPPELLRETSSPILTRQTSILLDEAVQGMSELIYDHPVRLISLQGENLTIEIRETERGRVVARMHCSPSRHAELLDLPSLTSLYLTARRTSRSRIASGVLVWENAG